MTLTFRSDLDRPLTSAELDGNFHDSDDRLTELEDNPPTPIEITNIYAVGTQCHVVLADATEFVFTLPQANFRPSIGLDIEAATDGTFTITSSHSNRYLRYDGSETLTIIFPADLPADTEVSFRQVGVGAIAFPSSTDVPVNGYDGFLNQTAGRGSTVTAKVVPAGGEWDLIGRLAEDVTA